MNRQSIYAALAALSLAIAFALAGCRSTHLGPDTGRAYRAALDAQRSGTGQGPGMSADDAANVLEVHDKGPAKKGSKGSDSTGAAAMPTALSSGSGGGQWQGASGNISLEAK